MLWYEDQNDPRNRTHPKKKCIVCGEPATISCTNWCLKHNIERIERISKKMWEVKRILEVVI